MNKPKELAPVLAEIHDQNCLCLSKYYEVVFYNEVESCWESYAGSKTFEDGEQVKQWKYVSDIFK